MNNQPILLEDGWEKLKTGAVEKIEGILEDLKEGVYKNKITTDEYSMLYTCAAAPGVPMQCRAGGTSTSLPLSALSRTPG